MSSPTQQLYDAISKRDLPTIQTLIHQYSLHQQPTKHVTADYNIFDTIDAFEMDSDQFIDLNAPHDEFVNLLYHAISYSTVEVVEVLLKNGALIDEPLPKSYHKSHIFCALRLQAEEDEDEGDEDVDSPLLVAKVNGENAQSESPKNVESPSAAASKFAQRYDCSKLTLKIKPNSYRDKLLRLLFSFYPQSQQSWAQSHALASVDLLLTYLHYGTLLYSINQVDFRNSKTPLYQALAQAKSPDIIFCLLAHGADTNAIVDSNDISLHIALLNYDNKDIIDVIRLLLQYGANPNKRRSLSNMTPLHLAVLQPHSISGQIITMLMNYGGDVTTRCFDQLNVLHFCVKHGKDRFGAVTETIINTHIEYLLNKEANANLRQEQHQLQLQQQQQQQQQQLALAPGVKSTPVASGEHKAFQLLPQLDQHQLSVLTGGSQGSTSARPSSIILQPTPQYVHIGSLSQSAHHPHSQVQHTAPRTPSNQTSLQPPLAPSSQPQLTIQPGNITISANPPTLGHPTSAQLLPTPQSTHHPHHFVQTVQRQGSTGTDGSQKYISGPTLSIGSSRPPSYHNMHFPASTTAITTQNFYFSQNIQNTAHTNVNHSSNHSTTDIQPPSHPSQQIANPPLPPMTFSSGVHQPVQAAGAMSSTASVSTTHMHHPNLHPNLILPSSPQHQGLHRSLNIMVNNPSGGQTTTFPMQPHHTPFHNPNINVTTGLPGTPQPGMSSLQQRLQHGSPNIVISGSQLHHHNYPHTVATSIRSINSQNSYGSLNAPMNLIQPQPQPQQQQQQQQPLLTIPSSNRQSSLTLSQNQQIQQTTAKPDQPRQTSLRTDLPETQHASSLPPQSSLSPGDLTITVSATSATPTPAQSQSGGHINSTSHAPPHPRSSFNIPPILSPPHQQPYPNLVSPSHHYAQPLGTVIIAGQANPVNQTQTVHLKSDTISVVSGPRSIHSRHPSFTTSTSLTNSALLNSSSFSNPQQLNHPHQVLFTNAINNAAPMATSTQLPNSSSFSGQHAPILSHSNSFSANQSQQQQQPPL